MSALTISSVLDTASKRATQELEATHAARDAVRSALDGYVAAVEAGAAARLAERLGVPAGERPAMAHAVAALLRALEQVPELLAAVSAAPLVAVGPLACESDSEAQALWAETCALGDMSELVDDHFRCVAEELAGRARVVQLQLGDRGHDSPESRVIRRLTWLASQRKLWDIHGLKRRDTGNWPEQVKVARRERSRFENSRPAVAAAKRVHDSGSDAAEAPPLVLERLAALSHPVAIVGGEVDHQKLQRLRHRTGIDLEWIGIDDVAPVERRVRQGTIGALVILEALVGHSEVDPVVHSARDLGVLLEYGGKAGLASIESALSRLDGRLKSVAA